MKIRPKIRIGLVVLSVFEILFFLLMIVWGWTQYRLSQKEQITTKITEYSFILSSLRNEYMAHPSERPKIQWIHAQENLDSLLEDSASLFTSTDERNIFENIEVFSQDLGILFGKLIDAVERQNNATVAQELWNQMLVITQTRLENSMALAEVNRKQAAYISVAFMTVMFILGIVIFVTSIISYIFSTRLTNALQSLGEETRVVAGGDYTHFLAVNSQDEIGELAQLFNVMIKKLQKMYTEMDNTILLKTKDLAEKVKEIEKKNKTLERSKKTMSSLVDELKRANSFLNAIFENIPDMIFLKDAKDLKFARLNRAGEKLLGYERDQLVGKSDLDFFPKKQADFFMQKDREVLIKGALIDIPEEQIETKYLGTRWLHTKKIPLMDASGQPEYLLGISEDVTERLQIDKSKTEFVSLASHQLRTPLTVIRWSIEKILLNITQFDPKTQEGLKACYAGVMRMSEIIQTILMITRIESGKIVVHNTNVNIKSFMQKVIEETTSEFPKRKGKVVLSCPSTLSIQTDPTLLKEILENLISNALKYSPNSEEVKVVAKTDQKYVKITVQDYGEGIPIDQQGHIFEKFFRADNIQSINPDGVGLGLYLTYAFTKLLGGTLAFVSVLKKGTTFTLRLPLSIHE